MPKFSPQELAEVRRKTEQLAAGRPAEEGPADRRHSAGRGHSRNTRRDTRRDRQSGPGPTPWGQKLVAPLLLAITVVVSWLVLTLSQG
ncbi:MAG: hypothetical protein COU69_03440 [Candidatus Pacebacteria bacterium CG10_big_fil_rev_8_21_14_0_10_56_10]|nr:MAG: hypothetical protein COU69_03440 [Candidatus Pacebacteria bacterium CG10_big_fil_rev_8_21_14_0_10_56_10]